MNQTYRKIYWKGFGQGREEVAEEKANGNAARWWYLRWRGEKGADEGSREEEDGDSSIGVVYNQERERENISVEQGRNRDEKLDGDETAGKAGQETNIVSLIFGVKKLKKQAVPNTDRVSKIDAWRHKTFNETMI
ncbi:hypothetical protein K438DRAFT_1779455 [Mycena galopus ATCC 62051]|nr:hypothetical protein K438DRAFT_1779455 [Mycena galopus ATCC 62051]